MNQTAQSAPTAPVQLQNLQQFVQFEGGIFKISALKLKNMTSLTAFVGCQRRFHWGKISV